MNVFLFIDIHICMKYYEEMRLENFFQCLTFMLKLRKYFKKVEKSNPKNTGLFDILRYFREVETNEHSLQAFGMFINCHYAAL